MQWLHSAVLNLVFESKCSHSAFSALYDEDERLGGGWWWGRDGGGMGCGEAGGGEGGRGHVARCEALTFQHAQAVMSKGFHSTLWHRKKACRRTFTQYWDRVKNTHK